MFTNIVDIINFKKDKVKKKSKKKTMAELFVINKSKISNAKSKISYAKSKISYAKKRKNNY